MPEDIPSGREVSAKEERRSARETVASYHQEQLRVLLDHVRHGFAQLDAGEIDEFELDDLIHRYKKAATKLWAFCGGGRGSVVDVARAIKFTQERVQHPVDWWTEASGRNDV